MSTPPLQFDREWLLLCEGESDKTVFDRLTTAAGVADKFVIRFPDRGKDGTGGRGKFGSFLADAIALSQSFRTNVKAILLVSDNDKDAPASFAEVQREIAKASLPVPTAPQTRARSAGSPDIVTLMIPVGKPGCLETICTEALYSKFPFQNEVAHFLNATPAKDLEISPKSKAELQCLFAASCASRPDTNLSYHWREPQNFHVPLSHPAFSDIIRFLSTFAKVVR